MAINVKAAMLICMGFIGGVSWVVERFESRPLPRRSPVVSGELLLPEGLLTEEGALPVDVDRRGQWLRQLARPNALDLEVQRNRVLDTARVLPPVQPMPQEFPAATLPPLAYHTGDAEGGAAAPSETLVLAARDSGTEPLPEQAALVAPRPEPRRYRVAPGDTLSRIARRIYHSSDPRLIEALAGANPQLARRRGRIQVGEELVIPDPSAVDRAPVAAAVAPATPAGKTPEAPTTDRTHWYTIRPNDTLAGIATKLLNDSRRWREIVELNGLSPRKIVPGTRIKLPPVLQVARG